MNMARGTVLLVVALALGLSACQPAEPVASEPPAAAPTAAPTAAPAASATATSLPLRIIPTPDLALAEWPLSDPAARPPALPVTASSDILYTSELLMDVYAPENAGDWPLVVLLHGAQDKVGLREMAKGIAGLGAVVFVPSWLAIPPQRESEISTGAENAACAVRTARARAAEFGGKADRVIVGAVSAGGTGGALVTLGGDEFHGDCLVQEGSAVADGFVGIDAGYDPFAAAPYSYYPLSLLWKAPADVARNDPFTYIAQGRGRDHVRFVLLVGSPEMILWAHGQGLRDALKAAGYSVELYKVSVTEHKEFAQPLPATLDAFASLLRP